MSAAGLAALAGVPEENVSAELRWLLFRATGDPAHLAAAKRLLDEALAKVPVEHHAAMLANLRVNREIERARKILPAPGIFNFQRSNTSRPTCTGKSASPAATGSKLAKPIAPRRRRGVVSGTKHAAFTPWRANAARSTGKRPSGVAASSQSGSWLSR